MSYWMLFLGFAAISALIFGPMGSQIAKQKQREPLEGLFLGVFFGPLGAIAEELLPTGPTHAKSGRSSIWDFWDKPGDPK